MCDALDRRQLALLRQLDTATRDKQDALHVRCRFEVAQLLYPVLTTTPHPSHSCPYQARKEALELRAELLGSNLRQCECVWRCFTWALTHAWCLLLLFRQGSVGRHGIQRGRQGQHRS